MDYLASQPRFNNLSLTDVLRARDQFHAHLVHKANVVGTAVGRYLIRKTDPYPTRPGETEPKKKGSKPPRTLENSEVREYSWPCVLVFVSEWVDDKSFGGDAEYSAADFVPKTIYMEDGRSVPVCVVLSPPVETAQPGRSLADFKFPGSTLAGGYPVISDVQGARHVASLGCLLTDGHKIYALTNRHVAGEPGEKLVTISGGKEVVVGHASEKRLGRMPFEKVYDSWPGRRIFVNLDVGLLELEDQTVWSPSVYGIGRLGPLADLSVYNLTLNLIGCPVRAHGCASGRLFGRIAALFYRYKSVGGFEYVADFLIGPRDARPLLTRPGDSGTVWVIESDDVDRDLSPVAVQWGGAVFTGDSAQLPFALATNLSTVCRELEVDLFRARNLATFEYWEAVGHYTVGAFACELVKDQNLRTLMMANRRRVGFEPEDIDKSVNKVTVPGFVPLANVPDKVWKKNFDEQSSPYGRRPGENPNHYANIDYPPDADETLDTLTPTAASLDPQTWRAFYKSVGWNSVSKRGLLPFRVWQIYKEMVKYVAGKDVARFVAAAGVLSHYVGDACQTLHGSYLTHGDPFRNPDGTPAGEELGLGEGFAGEVHGAYEGDMLDENVDDLMKGLKAALGKTHKMKLVKGGREAGFASVELMRRTRKRIPPMDVVEAYGALVLAGDKASAPTELWKQFGGETVKAIADGCRTLAMLWESAWAEGGGDKIAPAQLNEKTEKRLREIYEDRDFVPSKPLGQIDPLL